MPSTDSFCLLPKDVLAHVGSIIFVRMHGVVLSAAPEKQIMWPDLPAEDLFSDFLKRNRQVFVVLIPDEHFGVEDARCRDLHPLRNRFIGAIDGSAPELDVACRHWMHKYAAGNPFVILDNRQERYADDSCLVLPPYKTGMTKMDLSKAVEILKQASELMVGDTFSDADKLAAAANLELSGHNQLAHFALDHLVKDCRVDKGLEGILGLPNHIKWQRAASFIGVRLRVIVEPASD